jgi:signal peptidase I
MHSIAPAASRRRASSDSEAPGPSPAPAPSRRPGRLRDAVLTVLGSLGIVCVLWLGLAWIFGLSILVFITGSMAPAMPAGAAAIVQHVSAPELEVGDVVTVPKPSSGLPVTHRIVEIAGVDGRPAERELTLKGDANRTIDPHTYVVAEAERVVVAAPELGRVVVWAKSPVATAILTIAVAGSIVWALWPAHRRTDS